MAGLMLGVVPAFAQTDDAWSWPSKEYPLVRPVTAVLELFRIVRQMPARDRFESTEEYEQRWREARYGNGRGAKLSEPVLVPLLLTDGTGSSGFCDYRYDADQARYAVACEPRYQSVFVAVPGSEKGLDESGLYVLASETLQLPPVGKDKQHTLYIGQLGNMSLTFMGRLMNWRATLPMPRERARVLDAHLELYAVILARPPLAAMATEPRPWTMEHLGRRVPHRVLRATLAGDVLEIWVVDGLNKRVLARFDPQAGTSRVNPELQP